jgi:hypothetical protein
MVGAKDVEMCEPACEVFVDGDREAGVAAEQCVEGVVERLALGEDRCRVGERPSRFLDRAVVHRLLDGAGGDRADVRATLVDDGKPVADALG